MNEDPTSSDDDALGRLSEALARALADREPIEPERWAREYGVAVEDVIACQRALDAIEIGLGEEEQDGPPEFPRPELPGYAIAAELGRGGMGVVYRARQLALGRDVAVKVMRPGDLVFGDALRRFRSEARSLARLRHPHIVSVHDVGETRDGLVWYAMDLVVGDTLAAEIAQQRRLLPARALGLMRQVTSAIAHAHAQGVVHRDLKPQNVLIDAHGDAFVVDFGLARDAAAVGPQTLSGQLLGTPQYMSPEQARGDTARIGEASDVWALGAVLYECLTGRSPFAGKPLHETIRAILADDPPPPSRLDRRVPQALEAVCLKALSKRPEDRYATALAFGEELERFAQGQDVLARVPSRAGRVLRRAWRHRRLLGAAALGLLVALLALSAFVLPHIRREAAIAAAEEARGSGFPGAAVETYRRVLAELAADDARRPELEFGLVRALIDRAGELVLDGRDAEAQPLATEACALAEPQARSAHPTDPRSWTWQMARLAAVGGPQPNPAETENLVRLERLIDELRSGSAIERAVAVRMASFVPNAPELGALEDSLRRPIVQHLLRDEALRMFEDQTLPVDGFLDGYREGRTRIAWSGHGVEAALAELVSDREADWVLDALVLRTLCVLHDLPSLRKIETRFDEQRASPATVVAAARRLATESARWRGLTPKDAMRAKLDLLAEGLSRDVFALGSQTLRVEATMRRWTGRAAGFGDPAELAAWWTSVRAQDPEFWIRAALGIDAATVLDREDLLQRTCTDPDESRAMLWRHLLRFRVPPERVVPEGAPPRGEGTVEWRRAWSRALGIDDARRLTVQLALLAFEDGSPVPRLLGTASTSAAIDERFELRVEDAPLTPSRLWAGLRRPLSSELRATTSEGGRPRELRARLFTAMAWAAGAIREDELGPYLPLDSGGELLTATRSGLPGLVAWQSAGAGGLRLRLGEAGGAQVERCLWDEGRRTTDFIVLMRLGDESDVARGELADWQARFAAPFERAGREGFGKSGTVNWIDAAVWPTPAAIQALHELTKQLPLFAEQLRPALLLAGDAPLAGERITPVAEDRGVQAVRLLLGSPNEQVRALARDALEADRGMALAPAPASTLLSGLDLGRAGFSPGLASAIRQKAAERDGASAAWWSAVLLVVLTLVGFTARGLATGSRRTAGNVLAVLACTVLVFVQVQIDGVELTPPFASLAALACALALLPFGRRSVVRTVTVIYAGLFAGVMFATEIGVTAARVPIDLDPELWLAGLVVLTLDRFFRSARRAG